MDWTTGMVEYRNGGLDSFLFLFLLFIMLYLACSV